LMVHQPKNAMNEDQLIDKIDKDLEWKRGYAMTDEEVYIVKRAYQLLDRASLNYLTKNAS
jgi:hypothetical protein